MTATAQAATPQLPYDLMDPAVQQCPYAAYHWLLAHAPVYHDPRTGMVFVTGYDLMREVLRDPVTYSNALDWKALRPGGVPDASRQLIAEKGFTEHPTLSQMDDPLHAAKRGLVDKLFVASRIKGMSGEIEAICHRLIDAVIAKGQCDFIRDFAVPLPCIVIASQIGVPEEDIGLFRHWTDAIMARIGNMLDDAQYLDATHVMVEAQHYMKAIIDRRRAAPKDDMISDLILTPLPEGRLLDDSEIIAILSELLVGGNETTTSAIGSAMKMLLDNPALVASIRSDPTLMKNFVEEALRLETPIQGLYRVTTRDVELGGVMLPAGTALNIRWAAANRDACTFADPDAIDMNRRNAGAHMTFGMGIHHCLGAPLARLEMTAAFTALLGRLDNLAYAPDFAGPRYVPSLLQRSLVELPITFTPRAA